MHFIPPMLCTTFAIPGAWVTRATSRSRSLTASGQIHVAKGRTVAAYSRPGRSLLTYPGMAGLREACWPIVQAVLDGELCASTGMEGILGVFEARERRGTPLAFVAFDVLRVDGQDVMAEPWCDRRKRLEDIGAALAVPNVGIVPVTDDAEHLWATWVGWGGEGIVLKDRRSPYRPGLRSPHWLKVKSRVNLTVHVQAGDPELARWGNWGWAVRLTLTYTHPHTGVTVNIDEIVRVPQPDAFILHVGASATVQCWGFLPNGRLRHPMWMGWAP
jgi:ATP-dependent DNA ligase